MAARTSTTPGLVVIAAEPHVIDVNVAAVGEPPRHRVRDILRTSDGASKAPLIEPTFIFGPDRWCGGLARPVTGDLILPN